jgi:hypothetical protein
VQRTPGGADILDLDYAKLKLFQLSLLWRAGVARQEFFAKVDLGEYAETLRQMLHSSDPGSSADFGCHVLPLIWEDQLLDDFVGQPENVMSQGVDMVRMPFVGFVWLFRLGTGPGYPFSDLFLAESGTLPVRGGGKAMKRFVQGLAVTFGTTHG